MIMPKRLREGDLVAITATSGPCDDAKLANGVKVLEELGLKVRVMDSCYARHDYLAGSDSLRLSDLHKSFADKNVRAIFVARGGYGAARLLPRLDFTLIKQNAKIFVGFSDVTALHIAINQICNMMTYHGPMPAATFGTGEPDLRTVASLCHHIFEPKHGDELTDFRSISASLQRLSTLHFMSAEVIVPGRASGILTGGNLTLIASSLGTPYEIKTRGRILFMEEIQEAPYRVDRLLLQLQQAGKFKEAAGLVFGDFSPENLETLHTAITEIIIPENKPTIGGIPCGHTSPTITLPLGGWTQF